MALKKDIVLRIARALLLEPVDYQCSECETDTDAAIYLWFNFMGWHELIRSGQFPENLEDIKARIEAYTMDTPIRSLIPGEDPVTMGECHIDHLRSWRIENDHGAVTVMVANMVWEYLRVCDMQTDFYGQPWDPGETPSAQADYIIQMISTQISAATARTVNEVKEAIGVNLPVFIKPLLDAGLLRKLDVTHYTPDTDNHTGEYNGRTWGEVVIEVLEKNGKKPATWTDLFRDGYIVKSNGNPYADNAWHNLKSRKFKHKSKKI